MSEIIPATQVYRAKIAAAVAAGGAVPAITEVAWGTGTTPAAVDDIGLENEVHRQSVDSSDAEGVVLTIATVLTGSDVEGLAITEIGIFDGDGALAGRRVFLPKELEPGTELETTLELQF